MVGRDIASESTRREEMPEATKVTSWPAGVGQPISESRILPLKMHIWQFDHIRRTEKVRVKKGYILTSRDVVGLCVWLRTKDRALRYANLTNWRDWGYCRPADSDMSISTTLQIASDYSEWVSKFEGCNMRMEWPNWALGRGRSDWSCVRATTEHRQKSLSSRVWVWSTQIDWHATAGGLGSRADGLERKTRSRSNILRCQNLTACHIICMISDTCKRSVWKGTTLCCERAFLMHELHGVVLHRLALIQSRNEKWVGGWNITYCVQ